MDERIKLAYMFVLTESKPLVKSLDDVCYIKRIQYFFTFPVKFRKYVVR